MGLTGFVQMSISVYTVLNLGLFLNYETLSLPKAKAKKPRLAFFQVTYI